MNHKILLINLSFETTRIEGIINICERCFILLVRDPDHSSSQHLQSKSKRAELFGLTQIGSALPHIPITDSLVSQMAFLLMNLILLFINCRSFFTGIAQKRCTLTLEVPTDRENQVQRVIADKTTIGPNHLRSPQDGLKHALRSFE